MAMCAFSALIRETPGWWKALRDDTTLEQWRTSARAYVKPTVSPRYSSIATDYVISERSTTSVTATPLGSLNGVVANTSSGASSPLGRAISTLLARSVPLFDRVLTDLVGIIVHGGFPLRIADWYKRPEDEESEPEHDGEESDTDYDLRFTAWENTRPIILPDVPAYQPGDERPQQQFTVQRRTVQVITHVRRIILTPETPSHQPALPDKSISPR